MNIQKVEYPNAWPSNNWNGIIFGKDDLLTLDSVFGVGDKPEQPDED